MLKYRRPFATLIFTFLCTVCATAQTRDIFEQTTTSSIKAGVEKDGNILVTTINRRFTLTDLYEPKSSSIESLLLLEEFKSERHIGIDGQSSVIKVDAWLAPELSKKIWTIEQVGDVGRVFDDFYRVTKYGCCASIATDFYFNLRTGVRLFSATSELTQVIVPNTDASLARYVAYHSADGSIEPVENRKDNDLIGLIQYGSDSKVLQRIAVRSKAQPIGTVKLLYQNKMSDSNRLMLWGVDGKSTKTSLSDFSIVIAYGWAGDIILPVTNDYIDLSKATVPQRFTLEIVK